MGHGHDHGAVSGEADRRWLTLALVVLTAFTIGEAIAGLAIGSLALLSDAGHLVTDVVALAIAVLASKIAARPARGAFTYGFSRVDALSGQANGITLLLLAFWFLIEAIHRFMHPPEVSGGAMTVIALIGVAVNVVVVGLAARANANSLNVRGAVAHLINDLWAFILTAIAGLVIMKTGWTRADALASIVIAGLMILSGIDLIRKSGRVFLEAAPVGVEPSLIGQDMANVEGVGQVHDLHVWELGAGEPALSAHVMVLELFDCHEVAEKVRQVLADLHHISHATLQADHLQDEVAHDDCASNHGPGYVGQIL
jgi:cobalt-zinc-cadmium efflux system protein